MTDSYVANEEDNVDDGLESQTTSTKHMLTKVRISNFKRIKEAELEIGPVTYIVGGNNSGKSSAIQAIHTAVTAAQVGRKRQQRVIPTSSLRYSPAADFESIGHGRLLENKAHGHRAIVEFTSQTDNPNEDSKYRVALYRGRNYDSIGVDREPKQGSVIGCKQFSCSGDAVRRLIMGCRRMLSVEDRAAIMAGLEAGLSQTRIAHLIGRSPSVVCREIARHRGPGGVYQAEDAGRAAQVARRRPKKRLLDRDEILRRRVIFDLSQGRTPRQISGRLSVEACGTVAPMDNSPHAQGRTISHEAIYTWIYAHPKKTLIEHGVCLPSRRWMRKKPPAGGRTPPIVGMRLIDERPDIADRMIPGNWEGDLIIGKDGASACATLVERTTRYLIIVALPLGRRADQVCDALTRRIQGLPEGAMRTLTWDQGREMARHQRLTQDTGVEVFFAHPHSPWERGTNENTNRLIRRYLPKGTPITSHQPYLDAIAYELNNCPRATLGYRTPTEAFNQLIATTH